jgi:hypothetical protein
VRELGTPEHYDRQQVAHEPEYDQKELVVFQQEINYGVESGIFLMACHI